MVSKKKNQSNKDASPKKKAAPKAKHSSGGSKKGGAPLWQQILDNAHAVTIQDKVDQAPRQKVASMCGFPKETGTYKNAITTLKKKHFMTVDSEFLTPSALGRENAKQVDVAKSNEEQLEMAKERVTAKGKKLVDLLADGKAHSRDEVAKALDSDPQKPSWKNFLSLVKKEDCLEYCDNEDGKPALRLPDWLFPFNRPE